jgi:sulfhydrogenase subunit gamma (sulfur reductase)
MTARDLMPCRAWITAIVPESAATRTFVLTLDPPAPVFDAARPGQFVMLSVFGYGEAAFTLSALPRAGAERGTVVLTVRRVGALTGALFDLARGAMVGLRGPFGRGFPDGVEPAVYVAGGCGLSPLKPAISRAVASRPAGTPLAIVYGARDPEARIHRPVLAAWERAPDVHLIECVEHAGPGWWGRMGSVLDFLDEAVECSGARRAAVGGPPVMLPLVAERLCRLGIGAARVHVAIERYMKCGTGLCGHCYVNERYVCTDGPVFSFAELRELPDALPELRAPKIAATC